MHPINIDREQVRLLAIQIGCKAAAEQTGLSYDRVRQWSSRYRWFKKANPPTHPPVTPVTLPSAVLGKLESETKLSFAKSLNGMAKDSENIGLRHAGLVQKAVQSAAIIHGWSSNQDKTNTILNLGILVDQTIPEPSEKLIRDASNNDITDL